MQHKQKPFKSVYIAHYNVFVKVDFIIRIKTNANNCLCSENFGYVRPAKHAL